jgi:hypothetical protein
MPNTVPAADTGLPEIQPDLSRRVLLAAIPAAAIGIGAIRPFVAAEADPIFAAIEKHRAAEAEYFGLPERDATNVDALNRVGKACDEMFETVPKTIFGVTAFVAYLDENGFAGMDQHFQGLLDLLLKSPVLTGGANG